jgi:1,4-alpha-glucan branching enzyme
MTLSPPLLSMMGDELLRSRYHRYLDRLVSLAEREIDRTQKEDGRFTDVARTYLHDLTRIRRVFPGAVRIGPGAGLSRAPRHGEAGDHHLRRHPWLPPPDGHPAGGAGAGQVAVRHYRQTLGRDPLGIWLPECGYMPGHEAYLREEGIRFGFLESHGLTEAHPRPTNGVLAPIMSPGGVAFFGRDMESSRQVWSAEAGYPGDYDYREFYKDIGWELPVDYLGDVLPDGLRKNVGIKYYRVTGKVGLGEKQPYDRPRALEKAALHAGHFLENRQRQVQAHASAMRQPPLVVSPVRRGAVRPLVVRGAGLPELPLPQDALRPGRHQAHDPVGVPGAPSVPRGGAAAVLDLGREGLRRGLAQPGQRLDLPAPRHGRGAHGGPGAPVPLLGGPAEPSPEPGGAGAASWPRPPTGPSS